MADDQHPAFGGNPRTSDDPNRRDRPLLEYGVALVLIAIGAFVVLFAFGGSVSHVLLTVSGSV